MSDYSTAINRISTQTSIIISAFTEKDPNAFTFLTAIQGYIGMVACEVIARYGTPEQRALLRDSLSDVYLEQKEDHARMVVHALAYGFAKEFQAPDLLPDVIGRTAPIMAPRWKGDIVLLPSVVALRDGGTVDHLTDSQIVTLCGITLGPKTSIKAAPNVRCKTCWSLAQNHWPRYASIP